MAILPMGIHGRDARATTKKPGASARRLLDDLDLLLRQGVQLIDQLVKLAGTFRGARTAALDLPVVLPNVHRDFGYQCTRRALFFAGELFAMHTQ